MSLTKEVCQECINRFGELIMSLEKEVCQECINRMAGKNIDEGKVTDDRFPMWDSVDAKFAGWREKDEEHWKNNLVKCRVIPSGSRDIHGSPPQWCKFVTEHLVCQREG